jgi:hypothetical protein
MWEFVEECMRGALLGGRREEGAYYSKLWYSAYKTI